MEKTDEIYFYPSGNFKIGEFKGIPLIYYEGYDHYRNDTTNFIFEQFGLKKYYLRHDDDGNFILPVTIEEDLIWVNYCGCIFSPISLDTYFEIEEYKVAENATTGEIFTNTKKRIYLSEEESEAIVLGEDIDFMDFIEVITVMKTGE